MPSLLTKIRSWIVELPYGLLIVMAIFMAIAPIQPEPHLVQKFQWLMNGSPFKFIDVFDVLWHLLPVILIGLKYYFSRATKG